MKNGIFRSGAMLMISSVALSVVSFGLPFLFAAMQPEHEWSMLLTGFPAFCMSISGVVVATLYIIGFIQYSFSKGYNAWVTLFLLLGNFPGFAVLLLLPDLKQQGYAEPRIPTGAHRSAA